MIAEPALGIERLNEMLADSPFCAWLGARVESVDEERSSLEVVMSMSRDLERGAGTGQFHGGPIASLIDVAGDFALIWMLGYGVPTINFRTDYLRPATGSYLRAMAHVRRAGRTVGVVDIDVHDDQNRLVAVGRGCYGTFKG